MWESVIPWLLSTGGGAAAASASGGNPLAGALGGALGGGLGAAAGGGQAGSGSYWDKIITGLGGAASALGPALIHGMGGKGPLGASLGPKKKKGPTRAQEALWRLLAAKGGDVNLPFELFYNDPLGIEPREPGALRTGATIGGLGLAGALGALGNVGKDQGSATPASDAVRNTGSTAGDAMRAMVEDDDVGLTGAQVEQIIANISDEDWQTLPVEFRQQLFDMMDAGRDDLGMGDGGYAL